MGQSPQTSKDIEILKRTILELKKDIDAINRKQNVEVLYINKTDSTIIGRYNTNSRNVLILCDDTDGDLSILLPPAESSKGQVLRFKKTADTANTITISCKENNTIDGVTSISLLLENEDYTLTPDIINKEWHILGHGIYRFGDIEGGNFLNIDANGHLTLKGSATVFQDIAFSLSTAKVPASKAPTWATFGANTKKYTFAINDYVDLEGSEMEHQYEEGSTIDWHVHLFTNGVDGTDRTVKYRIYYGITNFDEVYSETSIDINFVIPANTIDKTQLYVDLGDVIGTVFKIGADITARFIRVVSDTGTAPSNDPFLSMVGLHIECDGIGSNTETGK